MSFPWDRVPETVASIAVAGRRRIGLFAPVLITGLLGACMTDANSDGQKAAQDKQNAPVSQSQNEPYHKTNNLKDLFRSAAEANRNAAAQVNRHVSPYAAFLAGQHAMAQNDYALAAQYFDIALKAQPDAEPLIRRTFFLYAATGNFDKAAPLADKLLKLNTTSPLPRVARIVDAYAKNKPDAVTFNIDALKGGGINGLLGALYRAWWAMRDGGPGADAALAALKPVQENGSFSGLYHFHAGVINDIAGRNDAARTHFTALLDDQTAISIYNVDAVASFFLRQGDRPSAEKIYKLYEAQRPGSQLMADIKAAQFATSGQNPMLSDSASGLAHATLTMAFTLRQGNDTTSALILTQATLAFQPDNDLAKILLGDIYRDIGRLKDSGVAYEAVPQSSPAYYTAALRLGDNYIARGKPAAAIDLFQGVADAYPDRPEGAISLGDVYRREKRFEDAANAYTEALNRIPKIENRHWEIYFNRGISYEQAKQWPQAEKDFKTALAMQPDQPYVLNYLGYSWLDMGLHIDEAKAMIEKAVDQRPRDGYITDSLGWAHYLTRDFEKATKVLQRAVELAPDDPTITDHYGDALFRAGRELEARFQWERVLTLKPEPELEQKIRDKLEGRAGPAAVK